MHTSIISDMIDNNLISAMMYNKFATLHDINQWFRMPSRRRAKPRLRLASRSDSSHGEPAVWILCSIGTALRPMVPGCGRQLSSCEIIPNICYGSMISYMNDKMILFP